MITPTTKLYDQHGRLTAAKGRVNNQTVDLCPQCLNQLGTCRCSSRQPGAVRTENGKRFVKNEDILPPGGATGLEEPCEDCPDPDKPRKRVRTVRNTDADVLMPLEYDGTQ